MQAIGQRGQLLTAGRPVALLGRWSLTRSGTTYLLSASIAELQDAYMLENATKFTVRLAAGTHVWQWRNATCLSDGHDVTMMMEGRSECLETDS
jgi:hypothetical protein